MNISDYKIEKGNDFNKIMNSTCPRKIVVGGPGTGKSYLFSELIKKNEQRERRNSWLLHLSEN